MTEHENRIVDQKTINSEYKRSLKKGYIPEGLYLLYRAGSLEDKKNPKALFCEPVPIERGMPGIFGLRMKGVGEAIVSWDGMGGKDRCPIMAIGTSMIVEPIELYAIDGNTNLNFHSEDYINQD